ncbi:GAF domain-containing sensor histidine kinase [Leifsonia shinshuensis]|uniref:GAF domain-containing sensor histidine kinase n=1 Tax=Leifsonia shinshuensis TaxID=150026 RepID=UPI0027E46AB1|nr:GAF domain-containing protein [Leifsonia shinshuensis]
MRAAATERRPAIPDDEPITFPDAPRAELDRALGELVEQARKVLDTQGRLRALVRANRAVVSHLELPVVLRTIIEAAVELVGARYGALGVIAEGGGLEQFIHVGMSDDVVSRIGHLPEGHGLLGALIDDPRPIRLDSIADDPRSSGFPAGHPPMTAFLGVPITVRDSVYGNLYLTDPVSGGFTEDDEQLVKALAANAGFAIDNARLYAETVARQAWSASAAEMTASILGSDAAEAHEEFASRAAALLGARSVVVLGTAEADEVAPMLGRNDGPVGDAGLLLDNDRVRSAVEGGQPTRLEELSGYPLADGGEPGPALVVPFDGKTGSPEVLIAVRASDEAPFTAFELERAVTFSRQAALAMELAEARADRERVALLEDRARIARDLHDHVIQQLFGVGLELQSVQSALGAGRLADRIDGTVNSLDDAIAQIRTAIFSLSHQQGPGGSLRHRLLDIVQEVGEGLPRPATVSFSGPVDLVSDAALADDVAAFVREGLTNVVRHAGADTATVDVVASADEITVDVADDGAGIGETSRRSGLANLSERAERRAGVLSVESTPQGTRLRLRLPVPAERVR